MSFIAMPPQQGEGIQQHQLGGGVELLNVEVENNISFEESENKTEQNFFFPLTYLCFHRYKLSSIIRGRNEWGCSHADCMVEQNIDAEGFKSLAEVSRW